MSDFKFNLKIITYIWINIEPVKSIQGWLPTSHISIFDSFCTLQEKINALINKQILVVGHYYSNMKKISYILNKIEVIRDGQIWLLIF